MVDLNHLRSNKLFITCTIIVSLIAILWGVGNVMYAFWPDSDYAKTNVPRPDEGWDEQTKNFIRVICAVDLLFPVPFTLIFAAGVYFKKDHILWTGLIAFSTWLFSSFTFLAMLIVNGAYDNKLGEMMLGMLDTIPVSILLAYLINEMRKLE